MERLSAPVLVTLERGGTVITADAQQAYQIRLAWAERQQASGRAAWASPDVLPLGAALSRTWIQTLLDDDSEQPTLLGAHQERVLWEHIVRDSGGEQRFLQPHGTVPAVMRAWRRMQDWAIDPAVVARSSFDEVRAFTGWSRLFAERCHERNWIDAASALQRMPLPRNPAVPWTAIGFDAPSTSLRALLARFQQAGVDAQRVQGPEISAQVLRTSFPDSQAEWRAAAKWALRRLLANPRERLAVVIPELEHERERIAEIFDEVLRPRLRAADEPRHVVSFAIEGGIPLARYPLVDAAITAIALACAPQPFEVASAWLRSPYILHGTTRAEDRARLDLEIRRNLGYEVDLGTLGRALERAARYLKIEDPLIGACASFRQALAGRQGLARWSQIVSDALRALGWPGARERDSGEQQTLEKFTATLAELAMLDEMVGGVDARGMLRHLRTLAEQTPFQPETGDAPLTLSARLAARTIGLDGLWVAGLEANAWPRAPRPDAFLPWELQRAAGIPQASAPGMLALARQVTGRWKASAREVILSWPQRRDEEDCLPSPLLEGLPQYENTEQLAVIAHASWHTVRASAQLETLLDDSGPPLVPGAPIAGGARSLMLQSQCAMHAFAERRLDARALEVPEPGIDPRTRGKLVHHALWLLWGEIETQDRLRDLDLVARVELVDSVVAQASAQVLERSARWPAQLVALERERLRALIEEWLPIELGRAPFRVVDAERSLSAIIAGHPIELRIDRIDELADERRLLIDYKTGEASLAAWAGERPDDAQLPLYASVIEPPLSGIAIARLRTGESWLLGVSSRPSMTGGKFDPQDWPEQLAIWRRTVERLAREFVAGDARVNPKLFATCANCHLHSFCRIDEIRGAAGDAHDE